MAIKFLSGIKPQQPSTDFFLRRQRAQERRQQRLRAWKELKELQKKWWQNFKQDARRCRVAIFALVGFIVALLVCIALDSNRSAPSQLKIHYWFPVNWDSGTQVVEKPEELPVQPRWEADHVDHKSVAQRNSELELQRKTLELMKAKYHQMGLKYCRNGCFDDFQEVKEYQELELELQRRGALLR